MVHSIQRAIGCMVAGAYGDMLGAAVEFMRLGTIRSRFGVRGITVPKPAYGFPVPVITDDTQMAIATGVGMRAVPHAKRTDDQAVTRSVWRAYREWHASQSNPDEQRAPGSTCMSALGSGRMGTRAQPLNGSAGCGGIMRAHPVGIACARDPARAFALGMDAAAITHGHPNGYVPAGALALLIADCMRGVPFADAVTRTIDAIQGLPTTEGWETTAAIGSALDAPTEGDHGAIIDASVGQLSGGKGGGWLGHDCLTIAIYAVRCAPDDPLEAVRIAVNHSGDSDSTGSVAGAIVGAIHGPDAFERALTATSVVLERHDELVQLAEDLTRFAGDSHG